VLWKYNIGINISLVDHWNYREVMWYNNIFQSTSQNESQSRCSINTMLLCLTVTKYLRKQLKGRNCDFAHGFKVFTLLSLDPFTWPEHHGSGSIWCRSFSTSFQIGSRDRETQERARERHSPKYTPPVTYFVQWGHQ
jgi:hypothetical protein